MTDRRTDFELRQARSTALVEMDRSASRARRAYWMGRWREVDDELRDRAWDRVYSSRHCRTWSEAS